MMRKWGLRLLRALYVGLIACLPVAAIANYQATQCASGCTNFASTVVSNVHYALMMLTDSTGADVSDTTNHAIKVNVVAGGAGGGVVTQPTGTNLHAVLDATSTTAVTQPTGTNLHSVVDSGTITTVSTVSASRLVGNGGATMDAAIGGATAPTNALVGGLVCNNSTLTPTAGQAAAFQGDANCYLEVNVKAATGLAQGSTTSGQTGSMIMGAVTTGDPAYTTAQTAYTSLDVKGHVRTVLGGGVPETISATGTTGATTATLATGASVTTYICGFSIRANATAAATGNATVTGVITGTMNFTQWTAPNASGVGVTEEVFVPCLPASAANTSIAVVSAAPGTGGVVSVSAWGYQQ